MKIQLESQDIGATAQRVVELLKPYLLGREEAKGDLPKEDSLLQDRPEGTVQKGRQGAMV